jgi:DNA-binding PadR family transcriptional regulator
MSKRHAISFQIDSQACLAKVDDGELEVLNEMAGTREWWRAAHLGGNPTTIGPSLRKLAQKGLVSEKDLSLGISLRATYVYRVNAAGEALLAAALEQGWRLFHGFAVEDEKA